MNTFPSAKDLALSPFSILKKPFVATKGFHLHSKSEIISLFYVQKELYRILAKAVHGHKVKTTALLTELETYKKSLIYKCVTGKKEVTK